MSSPSSDHWKWFNEARFGLFIHWGACAAYGRGEQVLFREHLDQREYEANAIGEWLKVHGECIYNSERGDVCDFVLRGRQTRKGNHLYLIIRFWDGTGSLTLAGLETKVNRAVLLTTGQELPFKQTTDHVTLERLPSQPPTELFPVIRLECDGPPKARPWAVDRSWQGDPRRMTAWAAKRGTSVWVGK